MKHRHGFTLVETLLSIALFTILMAALFGVFNSFQHDWMMAYKTQNVNKQIIRVYRAMDRDLSMSLTPFVTDFHEHGLLYPNEMGTDERFCVFPLATNAAGSDGYPVWNRIIVYRLRGKKQSGSTISGVPFKDLVRYEFKLFDPILTVETGKSNANIPMYIFNSHLKEALEMKIGSETTLNGDKFPLGIQPDIKSLKVKLVKSSIIETDITEMDIRSNEDRKVVVSLFLIDQKELSKIHVSPENIQALHAYVYNATSQPIEISNDPHAAVAEPFIISQNKLGQMGKILHFFSWITATNQ